MTFNLTRRSFTVLAAAAAAHPNIAMAGTNDYAFPGLLQSVQSLIPLVEPGPNLSPRYKQKRMVVIDVRAREKFEQGHIPGARHLDPNAVVAVAAPIEGALKPESELADIIGRLGVSAGHRVVLYDDMNGFHAARMFWVLEYLGHQNVALLNGGLAAWRAAGGPEETEDHETAAAMFTPSLMPRRKATADYIMAHQHEPTNVVIDVRPPGLFEKGHIPWAVNIPWSDNLDRDGFFLSARELRAHFEANGVRDDLDVVVHCQVGLASSHSYVALRLLGYPKIRVYHRSWAEWGNDPTLPKETGA